MPLQPGPRMHPQEQTWVHLTDDQLISGLKLSQRAEPASPISQIIIPADHAVSHCYGWSMKCLLNTRRLVVYHACGAVQRWWNLWEGRSSRSQVMGACSWKRQWDTRLSFSLCFLATMTWTDLFHHHEVSCHHRPRATAKRPLRLCQNKPFLLLSWFVSKICQSNTTTELWDSLWCYVVVADNYCINWKDYTTGTNIYSLHFEFFHWISLMCGHPVIQTHHFSIMWTKILTGKDTENTFVYS